MLQRDDVEQLKNGLVEQFASFLAEQPPERLTWFRNRIAEVIARTAESELARVVDRVGQTGSSFGYFPPEPFARHVHRTMADVTLSADSGLLQGEHLDAVRTRPIVFLPNHLSYSDANLFEILLHRAGYTDIAERVTAIAGPKVYGDPLRRFLSLCFGTIKTAQSSSRASGEAVMSAREVAAIARRTIMLAFERLDRGDALLIFAEGARSRDAAMQPLLPAVARYLEHPGSVIVPVGILGTEHLIAVGDDQLHPSCVQITIGAPIESEELAQRAGGRRARMAELVGRAIAALLPPAYRGAYA